MNELIEKIKTLGVIVKNKKRLPFGEGARGQFIPPEDGRRAIFVPSFGAMEKAEIDDVVEVAKEQEDERIKSRGISVQRAALEEVTKIVRSAPRGERAKTAKELIEKGV